MSGTISTYDELVSGIADYMNVAAADASIDSFIRLTESQFEKRLRVREMEKRVTYQIGSEDLTVPTDFLEARAFVLTASGRKLQYVSIDELEARKTSTGNPCLFSIWGEELLVRPVPDAASPVEASLRYVARVEPLSSSAPVNSVLTNYPDIYKYGALTQAAGYLKDAEMQAIWGPMFVAGVEDANKSNRKVVGQRLQLRPSGAPV